MCRRKASEVGRKLIPIVCFNIILAHIEFIVSNKKRKSSSNTRISNLEKYKGSLG